MIELKYLKRDEVRHLKDVRAIIVHWPSGGVCSMDALWEWMNKSSQNSYHYFISRGDIMQIRSKDLRAVHCGHRTYTDKARAFFGESVCSSQDSPNNYTLAVCMLHDRPNGSYFSDTMNTAIDLLAGLCMEYGLDPEKDLLRHSDLTDEKREPCPKGFFQDGDDPDDLWNEFKTWVREDITDRNIVRRHGL